MNSGMYMRPGSGKSPHRQNRRSATKPATRRGNVRQTAVEQQRRKAKQAWGRRLLVLGVTLLVISAGWGMQFGFQKLTDDGYFKIRQIELTGNASTAEERILSRLNLSPEADLPSLDLDAISQSILSHPWVARTSVRRIYPDTLSIRVWERSPAALLISRNAGKKPIMVDRDGVLLGTPAPGTQDDLPHLSGIKIAEKSTGDRVDLARVTLGLKVADAYRGNAPRVDVQDPTDPLLLVGGMRIRLGNAGGYHWRLSRLNQLSPVLADLAGDQGAEVDLRYPNRVVAKPL